MRNIKILNVIMFLVLLAGCSQPNFFVGGGQSLDLEAPKLTLLTPSNFSFVPSDFTVEGIVTDNVGIEKVVVTVYNNENEKIKDYNASISGENFKVEIKEFESGEYSLVVNAYDEANNTSTTSSKSISITVDAGNSNLVLREPLLFSGLSEETLDSKKYHVYADLDYFRNEDFNISGTIEEDYGISALTLQLEFVGSKNDNELFDASEDNPIVYNYRIFKKNGDYYYNDGNNNVLADNLFSGSLSNFTFKVDSSKLFINKKSLNYNQRHFFKVRIIAEKRTTPVESFDFYPGYLCVYPKSNEPWCVPSFAQGTSFPAGNSIFGEAYDDDGLCESSVFYCIAAKDKTMPKLEDFLTVGNSTNDTTILTWKIDLSEDILPGNYNLWYYAKDKKGVFAKETENETKPTVSSINFIVPDPGQPISDVEMFKGTDKSTKVAEYPSDENGDFLLAGNAYDTSNVQAVIFAWVPQKTPVPDWKETDWSEYIDENWNADGAFLKGIKYWRIPLGTPETTADNRKSYEISLQLNDREDFILEDGTIEYNNKHFYIFTKGADDAEGNKKFTIVNFTIPKDLIPPETNVTNPSKDDTENDQNLPITFDISAIDNENIVDKVYINTNGLNAEKQAVLKDGKWQVTIDSVDFIENEINEVKKFIVTAEDLYGNKNQSIRSIKIKNTAISISKVTSADDVVNITKSNGEIEIHVIAEDRITKVTGEPRLKLNVDNIFNSGTVYAKYKSKEIIDESKTKLIFSYTISNGDSAVPLNVDAIELNNGTIANATGNSISGDIPVRGANSLKNRNIIIDTTAPQIQSIITSVPKGAYGKGSQIDIKVSFDRILGTLDSSGSSTLILNTVFGGKKVLFDSNNTIVSGNTVTFNYVVSDGENTENLDVLTFENDGMIADDRGNKAITTDCQRKLANFREIIIDTTVPKVVSYGVNGVSGKDINTITYNTNVNSKIEIDFNEDIMKNSGSILLERVYKSYPAVLTNEEKASYNSIRSFSGWDKYYVNRCIGTVNNNGIEPDREAKWVLKYTYDHGAYETAAKAGTCEDLWNYFADIGATAGKYVDYNCIRIDVNSGLVKVEGKKVTITPPNDLPEGIMFYINVAEGVFLDRANNKNATSRDCKFETVNAAAPVIRINKLSGMESGSQPKSTTFKISSETYNASYYYGFVNTEDSGNIPTGAPTVNKTYTTEPVSIGNNDSKAYVYKIFAKTKNKNNGSYSNETKELAFKTVITNLDDGAFGSDSTGGPASTTEFPLKWGEYVTSSETGKYMSQATDNVLYSWHILKDFQYKSAASSSKYADGDKNNSNTTGLAGALCKCGISLKKKQHTISAEYTVAAGEALYFALTGNSTAIKGTQSGTTWSSTVSGSVTTFYVYKGPASLDDFVDINNTSLVCSTESFSIDETANPIFPTPVTLTATYTCAAGEALYFTGTFEGANNNATAFKGILTGTNTWTFDTYGFDKMTWKVLKGKDSLGDEVTIAGSSLLSMKGSVSYPTIKTTPVFPTPVTLTATYSGCKTGENIYFSGNFHGTENSTTALKGTLSGSTWTLTVTADTDTFNWYVLKGKTSSSAVANSGLLKMNETAKTAPTVVSVTPTFPEGRIAVTCTSGLSSTEAVYFAGTFDDGSTSKAVKGTKDSTGKWYLDVTFAGKGKSFTWSVYKGSSSYTSANVSSLTPAQGTNSFTGVGTQTVTFPTATYIYFKPNSDWLKDGARFAAYFFGNGNKWVSMTKGSDGIYYCEKPSGYPNVIFCRMDPNNSKNNWDNKWNQTADLTIPTDGRNYFEANDGWDGIDKTWSTWPPPEKK